MPRVDRAGTDPSSAGLISFANVDPDLPRACSLWLTNRSEMYNLPVIPQPAKNKKGETRLTDLSFHLRTALGILLGYTAFVALNAWLAHGQFSGGVVLVYRPACGCC